MKLCDFENNFIFKTTINLDDENFIILKEPELKDISKLSKAEEDETKMIQMFGEILPSCIVDSSFENENGEKASGKEIAEMLKKSGSMFPEIIGTWIKSIPFHQRLQNTQK
jgi:hypothetical protein